jgi:hypothetical protein
MPVDQKRLLKDCQKQLRQLEADLKVQVIEMAELDASLRAEHSEARAAGRVGDAFEIWRGEQITQGAVHWVLACVFVRFLEDNRLIDPRLAGDGDAGLLAEAAEQTYYASNPTHHERNWLLEVFRQVAALPGGRALFDEAHNPAFRFPLSPDASKQLLRFWREIDATSGALAHSFDDPTWDTRFLGDLYQNLSEAARSKYALLQTPLFVEEFVLDRTLGEALKVLPLVSVTLIDPTSGSGHFLLGALARLLVEWERTDPGAPREVLVQRALDQIAGVDLNPFAVAIARFRLLIAALIACDVTRLDRAPGFQIHVAVGDALLHGDEPGRLELGDGGRGQFVRHAFDDEDLNAVNRILGRRYAVVVGNPPYITPKDKALSVAYRERYKSCHRQYALSVPFVERFWELASSEISGGVAGWIGQITANSFAKREFGKKLIEEFFPRVDLTHVLDSAGAYIPGHGTPTVLLFGRARPPVSTVIRAVLGIRGEPETPTDPSRGEVWSAIRSQVEMPGSEGMFVSAEDVPRERFLMHPWSLGGGGAADLKGAIEAAASSTLANMGAVVGRTTHTGEDGAFVLPTSTPSTRGWSRFVVSLIEGDNVRDWTLGQTQVCLFPYDRENARPWRRIPEKLNAHFWSYRSSLRARVDFGQTVEERGLRWFEHSMFFAERFLTRPVIAFAFVSTHNQFVLGRDEVVYKQSAPVIALPGSDYGQLYGVLGLLNSSVSCFWLKQVCHNKGGGGIGGGLATEAWEQFYEFTGTAMAAFPLVRDRPAEIGEELDVLARERSSLLGSAFSESTPNRASLDRARARADELLRRMIGLQEELDWKCYKLYEIADESVTADGAPDHGGGAPPLRLGERAFEIVLARRLAVGEDDSTWFVRHASNPITELPTDWPRSYRDLVERRITLIEQDRHIALLERPENKRRWNLELWEDMEREALDFWLLDRLESRAFWPDAVLQTTRDLAERAAVDPSFAQVASLRFGDGVPLESAIRQLVIGASVPFLAVLRYAERGREKHRVWNEVWELQRREDIVDSAVATAQDFTSAREGESTASLANRLAEAQRSRRMSDVGQIPRPPKYVSADFQRAEYWRMRGALDVPKERFTSYQFCGRDGDDVPLVGWAGWTHLQQAQALSAWYAERRSLDGWSGDRLAPILAGVSELLPWLRQWHNDIDPEFSDRPGDAYALWLDQELQGNGITPESLKAWEPPRSARRGSRPAAKSRSSSNRAE